MNNFVIKFKNNYINYSLVEIVSIIVTTDPVFSDSNDSTSVLISLLLVKLSMLSKFEFTSLIRYLTCSCSFLLK